MTDFRQVLQAASFAARAHRGQLRKDGHTPYASHPFRVCLIVRDRFGLDDPRLLAAALLHDALEDTTADFDDLERDFGPDVAAWVACLSKDKRLPDDERERAYVRQLLDGPWQAQVLKLADVYDNLLDARTLPRERQPQGYRRAASYHEALRQVEMPEVRGPLAQVGALLEELRRDLQG